MKFETYNHKILKNYLLIFHKDPCTYARTRGKNMRTRVWSRQNAFLHIYASYVCMCARIFMKNLFLKFYYLININLKFHKDPSFCCEDICKTILTFNSHQFSMYFPYLHSYTPQKQGAVIFKNFQDFFCQLKFCFRNQNIQVRLFCLSDFAILNPPRFTYLGVNT